MVVHGFVLYSGRRFFWRSAAREDREGMFAGLDGGMEDVGCDIYRLLMRVF